MRSSATLRVAALGPLMLLAGCIASGNPFSNPFGAGQRPPQPVAVQPAPNRVIPSVTINAAQARVQDTIVQRARRRGTNVLGANNTGVTLEIPLRQSPDSVVQQCGPHTEGRAIRVYLETVSDGPRRTIVNEEKFIIDGTNVCTYAPTEAEVADSNRSLADLKRDAEQRLTAEANRRNDPEGNVEALDPSRPVRPLR